MSLTYNYYVNSTRSCWWAAEEAAYESKRGKYDLPPQNCWKYNLSHQGIALCKGKQDEESNFKKLLLLWAEDDEVLRKWIEKSYDKHMSLNGQNERLQIMALKVLHGIASDIAESGYYSIMAE